MFHRISQWKRQRREQRRRRKLNDPATYPVDMRRDVVDTMVSVKDYTMTSVDRLHGLCEAVRYMTSVGIQGDIVECGVWRGGSMMAVAKMLNQFGDTDRHLHLFDTFSGMSAPTSEDIAVDGQTAETLLDTESKDDPTSVWCVSSLDEVKSHMKQTGYDESRIHYHKGMVEDTIPAGAPDKIALLRLDTDWYESTRHEMEHLFPRLADGGVLIVDDYGHWEGARRAVDEYFAEHQIGMMLHRLDYTGRIGIHHASIKRADSPSQPASGSSSAQSGAGRDAA
ncbi:Demethyldecarbamoylnovobiocin O-methyltransferase [Planctomycetes bacterium CA13]|uniref:Demethyldecarbamoylnovobiocin O-methyltransferase n=1 Tax=Novipirellula herctigrandis TaxID=2527986 RepID=A0A5C5Z7R4_9BACT|nr:Demethyldecarbamoylnovobiocin O-methyltransferase [Planctomycetes bacterium CA13]